MVLLIGRDIDFLEQLTELLSLEEEAATIVQTERELSRICACPENFPRLVLVDMLYIGNSGGPIPADQAIARLRKVGFTGTIIACSRNPIFNPYLVRLGGADFTCGNWEGDERNCPDLSLEEICAALQPHLN